MSTFIIRAWLCGCLLNLLAAPSPATGQIQEAPITASDREHWSLVPLTQPRVPANQDADGHQTAVDFFIGQQLEQAGLSFAPPASRGTLIRRLSFDLRGIPPTVDELNSFVTDSRDDAYARLVESMLASPEYGERWAQHWLDLARFAETDGFEHDRIRQGAWGYRDWVINALNRDLPYDQFLRRQLAGDLIPSDGEDHSLATMFCLAGPDMPDINEQDLRRHDRLNELTSTIGSAILGLQMHCAQCHDHKYDAISQADFYRLRAVFESALPKLERDKHVLVLKDQPHPIAAKFYHRGDLNGAGEPVTPGFPRVAVHPRGNYLCNVNQNPRLQLSDWLCATENPLTARVIANRVWQHHFGISLTENPSDFGVIAGGPSHPALLDWLAGELRAQDWSLKSLHRKILLSRTYRQTGQSGLSNVPSKEQREVYAGFPRKRLDGESIRDALLFVSGDYHARMGGPSVFPPLPPEMVRTLLKNQWKTSPNQEDHFRRSIYTFARRNLRYPVFDVFDRPDAGTSCALRDKSTTPIQSLLLLNSDLTIQAATKTADQLMLRHAEAGPLIEDLFQRALGRNPTETETTEMLSILSDGDSLRDNLVAVCVGIFNCNEFIYVD